MPASALTTLLETLIGCCCVTIPPICLYDYIKQKLKIAMEALDLVLTVAHLSLGRCQRKHKLGLQSGPGLLLVSGLGFAFGQSCFA